MTAFRPGTLRQQAREVAREALRSGARRPIATELREIDEDGTRFLVTVAKRLAEKPRSSQTENPFLPYEPELYVGDIGTDHVCLLNKYNVVEDHLLIVTREFEDQTSPLAESDFAALASCLMEYDSLGFFNAGTVAGASQPHKHLQLIPLPLGESSGRLPLEPLFEPALAISGSRGGTAQSDLLRFPHRLAAIELVSHSGPAAAARSLYQTYWSQLRELRLDGSALRPYNLLVTRYWMLLVPRRRECFRSISLNALAFVGAFFVRNEESFQELVDGRPWAALRHVAGT